MKSLTSLRSVGIAGLVVAVATATAGCGESEPSHNLADDELAAFCPAAIDWFEVYDTRKQGEWGSSDAEWLASHEAEATALASLDPVIQPGWQDRYGNDLRRELQDVMTDNEGRLAAIAAADGTRLGSSTEIININIGRRAASLNNFVLAVCERN